MSPDRPAAVVLTREELYERIWTTAMRHVAPELGVSDVGLKKICRRHNIPTPPLGYWAKKEAGKAPKRPPLPPCDDPRRKEIRFFTRPGGGAKPEALSEIEALVDHERHVADRIAVPESLDDPHPLVERTLKSIRAARPNQDGLAQPRAKRALDVRVSPDNVDRAARILDAVVRALEGRSLPLRVVATETGSATAVAVLDEEIRFDLSEIVDRVERPPTQAEKQDMERWWRRERFYNTHLTGRLCLEITSGPHTGRRRRFADTNRRSVERLLNAFVANLYRTADDIKTERAERERRERELEEARRRRREHERLRAQKLQEIREEEQHVDGLLAEAKAWQTSQTLRAYIEALRAAALEKYGQIAPGSRVDRNIGWAARQADRLDPLTESPPSILDETAKWKRVAHW